MLSVTAGLSLARPHIRSLSAARILVNAIINREKDGKSIPRSFEILPKISTKIF